MAAGLGLESGQSGKREIKRGRESFVDRVGRVGIDAMANATASSFSNRWFQGQRTISNRNPSQLVRGWKGEFFFDGVF